MTTRIKSIEVIPCVNKVPRVGVGVLIVNENNQILLGERMDSHGRGSWGPAGGHLEYGESPEECAIREVFEETGLQVSAPHFLAIINTVFEQDAKLYVSIFMRVAYPKDQQIQNIEPHKTGEWKWFDWNHLPSNLFLPLKQFKEHRPYELMSLDGPDGHRISSCI